MDNTLLHINLNHNEYQKILPLLLLLTSFSFYAQSSNIKDKKEQIKALKVSFNS
jgi:hypothetical protein